MDIDFSPYFEKYKALVDKADEAFKTIQSAHSDCVTCKPGCSDCCFALFDLTLVEAMYINYRFHGKFEGAEKAALIEKANRADRRIYKIKRQAYKYKVAGKDEVEILSRIGSERVRCPLLDENDMCLMYEDRPLTCRLYGLPINIQGMTHTCGKTGFEEGKSYPTIYMDRIQHQLYAISEELVGSLKTRHTRMAELLVPLSMAVLTVYDEEYLGLVVPKDDNEAEAEWKTSKKKKRHGKKQSSILCRLGDSDRS